MANVLVDTSVWVDYFRGIENPATDYLHRLLDEHRVALCGVVELELLQGAKPGEKGMLKELLSALSYIETERVDYQAAGELINGLKAEGFQIPATDGLIASLCVRHHLLLLTLDKHFDLIHQIKKVAREK